MGHETTKYGTDGDPRRLAELAEDQHGVVALHQLLGQGLSSSAVRSQVARGRLRRLHHGVYAVGHAALTRKGYWLAAVLACGSRAVLSHRDCGALHDLRPNSRSLIEVTVPRGSARSRPGIQVHRVRYLDPDDITSVDGIPCTTVARTLLDLAEVIDRQGLERACERAEIRVARAAGRHGAKTLRSVLDELGAGKPPTRNELERAMFAICRGAGFPLPLVNHWLDHETQPDFTWPEERVIAEVDGYETHGTRRAFARDRKRDRRLVLDEWRVVHFTWREVMYEPDEIVRTLRSLLATTLAA